MVNFCFGDTTGSSKTFAFTFTAVPFVKFSFDAICAGKPRSRSFKRRRPLWDVDGGATEGKKKRRLRLELITSRLSRPFSSPATNIISRGSSKIAIWAKNRSTEKSVLRKAAIMNHLRSNLSATKAKMIASKEQETARQGIALSELVVQRPKWDLPPSPLGLSNYDALDLEDELFDDHCDGESAIYTDFNIMKPYTPAEDDSYEYLDELDGIPLAILDDRPPHPHDEGYSEILKERERQKELCFVKFES